MAAERKTSLFRIRTVRKQVRRSRAIKTLRANIRSGTSILLRRPVHGGVVG